MSFLLINEIMVVRRHTGSHTYEEMADDLFEFFEERQLKDAVLIGHSMGEKTAMAFAAEHTDLLHRLIVVDMGVKQYPVHHEEIIRAMQAVDLGSISSRKEAEEMLGHLLDEDESTLQFLLKNVYRNRKEGGSAEYAWRFNLDVIAADIEEMGLAITKGADIETLFLYGSRSDYIQEADRPEILRLFPKAAFRSLDTGHWVHAENPQGFVDTVRAFVTSA